MHFVLVFDRSSSLKVPRVLRARVEDCDEDILVCSYLSGTYGFESRPKGLIRIVKFSKFGVFLC